MGTKQNGGPKVQGKFNKLLNSDNVVGYVFIGLFIIGFLWFTLYPLIYSLYLSFTN